MKGITMFGTVLASSLARSRYLEMSVPAKSTIINGFGQSPPSWGNRHERLILPPRFEFSPRMIFTIMVSSDAKSSLISVDSLPLNAIQAAGTGRFPSRDRSSSANGLPTITKATHPDYAQAR